MEGKAKPFGHPIHPMLNPFPLGLLATSVAFDVVHLLGDDGKWAAVAQQSRERQRSGSCIGAS